MFSDLLEAIPQAIYPPADANLHSTCLLADADFLHCYLLWLCFVFDSTEDAMKASTMGRGSQVVSPGSSASHGTEQLSPLRSGLTAPA